MKDSEGKYTGAFATTRQGPIQLIMSECNKVLTAQWARMWHKFKTDIY